MVTVNIIAETSFGIMFSLNRARAGTRQIKAGMARTRLSIGCTKAQNTGPRVVSTFSGMLTTMYMKAVNSIRVRALTALR